MAMTIDKPRVPATGANDGLHRAGIALRGVVAIALGGCALYFRVYSTLLVGLFVAFAIIDGIVRIVIALRSTGRDKAWLLHALEGLVGVALGVVAYTFARSLMSLTWTIAEWAFGIGVLTIAFAAVTWGRLHDAWMWLLSGILLIALGGALLWFTIGGLLAPGIALGLFGIIYGAVSLLIALRAHPHEHPRPPDQVYA
ncbi:MAG: hypothetical protein QOJ39_1200 [Candidatus Eremiobacteraeota bacterium]|jgi:uncharacterized membrane protein HdeD (DUF308 family)|nr:hypothetical protein [Candidatus Eremiobacteraeota bacterium]MEA2719336.1 hypothetical protein [Candidatus Eremiobacteraeota bacterium]